MGAAELAADEKAVMMGDYKAGYKRSTWSQGPATRGGKQRTCWCPKCNKAQKAIKVGRVWRCTVCSTEVEPPASKYANVPKANPHTGRMHQSTKEANRASTILALRNAGVIGDVRGLDRGDPQERFRLEVYGSQAVAALCEAVEAAGEHDIPAGLRVLARDVRRSLVRVAGDYLADFTYTALDPAVGPVGTKVVEDVKGWRSARYNGSYRAFLVKKALMLACHGIEVKEV